MYEPRDYELVFAVVLLTLVIALIGAPFAWNEYNKWIDREKISRNFKNIFVPEGQAAEQLPMTGTIPPVQAIPVPVRTPVQPVHHTITDGFWCRDTTKNIGKDPTDVRECYQFLSDGTFKWGYSPGYPMGKSPSCWAPDMLCTYSLNARGQYEVRGGYFYTLYVNTLIDPHDPPYFTWSGSGVP